MNLISMPVLFNTADTVKPVTSSATVTPVFIFDARVTSVVLFWASCPVLLLPQHHLVMQAKPFATERPTVNPFANVEEVPPLSNSCAELSLTKVGRLASTVALLPT